MRSWARRLAAGVLLLATTACGPDDGAAVRGAAGAPDRPPRVEVPAPPAAVSGYLPGSDIARPSRLVLDVCEALRRLESTPPDFSAAVLAYAGAGTGVRGLRSFAASHALSADAYSRSALEGTGPFAAEPSEVRAAAARIAVRDQVLVAWAGHEMVAADDALRSGALDPDAGAPHHWDLVWARLGGANTGCAPAAAVAALHGNGSDGRSPLTALREAVTAGREAAIAGDRTAAAGARGDIERLLCATYLRAALGSAAGLDQSLAMGDSAGARVRQAEAGAFLGVVEPLLARVDAAAARRAAAVFDLRRPPEPGSQQALASAVRAVRRPLGLAPGDVGLRP